MSDARQNSLTGATYCAPLPFDTPSGTRKMQARSGEMQRAQRSAGSLPGGTLVAPKPWDELGATGTTWVQEERKREG